MYRDNSLMPKETVRLAALGLLAGGEWRYADLAQAVRHFTTRYWGPTLDVMASSIELLRFEGLVETVAEGVGLGDERLRLTEAGEATLRDLLRAAVRAPTNDFSKLVVALKMKFLHLLPAAEQREQAEALIELRQAELARLIDLRGSQGGGGEGYFLAWLDHDIAQAKTDLAWFEDFRDRLAEG